MNFSLQCGYLLKFTVLTNIYHVCNFSWFVLHSISLYRKFLYEFSHYCHAFPPIFHISFRNVWSGKIKYQVLRNLIHRLSWKRLNLFYLILMYIIKEAILCIVLNMCTSVCDMCMIPFMLKYQRDEDVLYFSLEDKYKRY